MPSEVGFTCPWRIFFAALLGLLLLGASALQAQERGEREPLRVNSEVPGDAGTPQDDASSDVEEIVIEGQADTGIANDAPASTAQFGAAELTALGAADVSDLARVTPNLEINTLTSTTPTFFIRGVGLNDFNSNAAGAVAIYVDDIPINAPALQLGQLFDIQTVEVLRGPQGYGDNRNASAGAIKSYSVKPDGSFEGFLRTDYGNFNFVDLEGAIALPLVTDILSSRFAFRFTERDPIVENRCGGLAVATAEACNQTRVGAGTNVINPYDVYYPVPAGLPSEVNDSGRWGARAEFRYQPTEVEMDWLLQVHGGKVDEYTRLGQVLGTYSRKGDTNTGYIDPDVAEVYDELFPGIRAEVVADPSVPRGQRGSVASYRTRNATLAKVARDIGDAKPFENDYDFVGKETQDTVGGYLRGDFPLGPVLATTITGIEHYDRTRDSDYDFSSNAALVVLRDDEAVQWTQQLLFEWEDPDRPLVLNGGSYFLQEDLKSGTEFFIRTPTYRSLDQNYTQDLWSVGVFAGLKWDFLDDFVLEGGIRFNWERKDFEITAQQIRENGTRDPPALPDEVSRTWSAPSGGLSLTYFFDDQTSIYWKYTRGWKAGHINAFVLRVERGDGSEVETASTTTADPETINSFEVGLRSSWFDDRLELGGALFYYQYKDYQVYVTKNQVGSPPQLEVINANDARVWGAEADFRVEPLLGWVPELWEQLVISGRFGWLQSEFLDFVDTRSTSIPTDLGQIIVSVANDYTGNRLPNTPRFAVSAEVEYRFELGRFGTLIPRYDFSWKDDIFFDPSEGTSVQRFFDTETIIPKYAVGQRAYAIHNLRLGLLLPSENVEIAAWVRNLTDEIYKSNVIDISDRGTFSSLLNFVGDPRTYGGSISVSF